MGPPLSPPPALAADASLFLDLDGTIIDFAEGPEAIIVDEMLRALLIDLERKLDGRLAVLTGRSLANLDKHLSLPSLSAAGSHGLEWRHSDGRLDGISPSDRVSEATAEVIDFARPRGLVVEEKPGGVAVHYRTQPQAEPDVEVQVARVARRHGLAVQQGSMVRELRMPGPDKGYALSRFMGELPFSAGIPIAVGDDLTDEHAFEAAAALGGHGILIGARVQTAARYALPTVGALRQWLEGLP